MAHKELVSLRLDEKKVFRLPGHPTFQSKACVSHLMDEYVVEITGPYIARGQRGQLPPPGKLNFFF